MKQVFRHWPVALVLVLGCAPGKQEEVFHAGPAESGLGVIYFGLYSNGSYQFCDGDFMDHGCTTGPYQLLGDTIVLQNLKLHPPLITNRFLIRRYVQADAAYWAWKQPAQDGQRSPIDTVPGATGDVWPLDSLGRPVRSAQDYWVIRLDWLKR